VSDSVDPYSFTMLKYEKVLSDCSVVDIRRHSTCFVISLIGMVSLKFRSLHSERRME